MAHTKKGRLTLVGMVRIEEGGEFGGRHSSSSKDMRDRAADSRDREKPRTVANMRERDRTLRWQILLFSHSYLYLLILNHTTYYYSYLISSHPLIFDDIALGSK